MTPEVRAKYLEKLTATTRGYGGEVQESQSTQLTVSFPDMLSAASWARTFDMTAHVVLDAPAIVLDAPVALIFSLLTYADQMGEFLHRLVEKAA